MEDMNEDGRDGGNGIGFREGKYLRNCGEILIGKDLGEGYEENYMRGD